MKNIFLPNEYVTTTIQFTLPLAIFAGVMCEVNIGWWLLSILMFLLYTIVGNNLALHRYYSHNEFEIGNISEWIFGWLSLTLCIGSQCSYAYLHINHHKHPYSGPKWTWRDLPFYRHIWFDFKTVQPLYSRRIVELKNQYGWMHEWNLLLVVLYIGILYLIDYRLFLFGWWIPITSAMMEISLAVYFQHKQEAENSRWHKWFPTWEGLHKNHHDYPGDSNNAHTSGQIDYTFLVSKLFVRKYRNTRKE